MFAPMNEPTRIEAKVANVRIILLHLLQVPSRLKEALKAAKESLERRLQEEQRVVRPLSRFTSLFFIMSCPFPDFK